MDGIREIDCGEQLTIAQCAEVYQQLLAAMAEGQAVNIDVSQLQRIDTATLQLFFQFPARCPGTRTGDDLVRTQ